MSLEPQRPKEQRIMQQETVVSEPKSKRRQRANTIKQNISPQSNYPESFWTVGLPESVMPRDGIPIGIWRESVPHIGSNGESIPADAYAMRIWLGDRFGDVLTPVEYPKNAEQWAKWLNDNISGFGDLQRILQSPDIKQFPEEVRTELTRQSTPERIKQTAGILTNEFTVGVEDSYAELSSKNPNMPGTIQLVFTPLEYEGLGYSEAAAFEGTNIVAINTRRLETLSILDPDVILSTVSPDGKPWHETSLANMMYLHGREETNHLEYFMRYGISSEVPLDGINDARAQYDAQPHEFRALLDQRRYVFAHPEEFPSSDDAGQGELEVLNERIHEAIAEIRKQR